MNDVTEVLSDVVPTANPALTPESLNNLLRITVPTGSVTVKGVATEVHYWKKPGDTRASKIYGRLGGLGDASIRFELQPYVNIQDNEPVVLHGTLRIKPFEAFRTTHEVILVGDMVGNWLPGDASQDGGRATAPLVRQQPRMTLEVAVARHGLSAVVFLATGTAWQDLTNAASAVPAIANCHHVETNFMQPGRFIEDLLEVCRDSAIKVLVIARGGGRDLAAIGGSHEVAATLLASGRVFYTAIGHDKDVLLLDKHADQAFATPSVLGQALAEAIRTLAEREALVERVSTLSESADILTWENTQLKAQLATQSGLAREKIEYAVREKVPDYAADRHAPETSPQPSRPANWYVLWALLVVIVFLVGRCSGR
ncbi:hypothetical protein HX890_12675 [Pseudomonas gingeri]|uniref:exodeoxyribonuclease VII large subunit n=1 Tax=Pseudomonas gingeri TaxID=117681 RepID=UPI0015A28596|nr:exodeoxyribonuclease VII large subunit [Pseudomonas gingeri]NWD74960.1 hypothetical protein [Pseudomonas gingeri]